ncbi:MAG: carboxypeptidase regulatory-like domain-containing protein, partial [candidate division Zixibacteria bacterium]|nr:carboxypeptidase regulatory-like domain-containing protein [candidate division Zixibacteria bacterium]
MFSKRNQLLAILLAILMTLTVGCFTSGDDNNITNPPTQPETGLTTLTGTITDAVTGDPIAGATITLTGSDTVTTTTNDSGEYTFSSLTTGEYQISISIDGYITTTSDVTVNETEIPVNITDNLVISEELSEDVFRFVLSWGESPSDLDAHLWTGDYHIYYGNKGDSASEPYMFLDIDDTQSYGPETITIKQITGPC